MEALLLTIVDYHHTNEQLVAIASVLANFLLFTVIVHERNKNLRPYARLLLVNCAMDLVYTIVYAATELVSNKHLNKCFSQLALLNRGLFIRHSQHNCIQKT